MPGGPRRYAVAVVVAVAILVAGCTTAHPGMRQGAAPGPQRPTTSAPAPASTAASTQLDPSQAIAPSTSSAPAGCTAASLALVPQVAADMAPSVVTILAGGGNGSGVVYTAGGLILTNEHVVRGARSVQVEFADGRRFPGVVTATDPVTDLALVRVNRTGLPAAAFDTALPTVGSLAVVIGSPLGFQNTVTAGVISGLHRSIPGSAAQGQSLVDLIQTDAPISPGNSGGAVVDGCGKVIGISEAYIPPSAGAVALGFAIPAATAVDVAEQLETTGKASHAFAGLIPAAITPQIAADLHLASTDGVIVADLVAGGPAAAAGLAPGDVITAVDGTETRTPEDFLAALRSHRAGDVIDLTVQRPATGRLSIRLTLAARPG